MCATETRSLSPHSLLSLSFVAFFSSFFLEDELTMRQQEERRVKVAKNRVARNEGKSAWLFKGKYVIAHFGHLSNVEQQVSKDLTANSSVSNYRT